MVGKRFLGRLNEKLMDDTYRREMQIVLFPLLFGLISLFMSFFNVYVHQYALMRETFFFGICCLSIAFFAAKFPSHRALHEFLFAIAVYLLLTSFIITGGVEGYSPVWIILLPCCGLYALGTKNGTILCGIEFITLLFLFCTSFGRSLLKCEYTDAFLHRFPLTYACTYFVGLLIETVRAKTNEALVTSRTMYAHLSRTDELTGLHNRMGLQAKLNELFAADAIDFSIAFVIMDLDDFKSVNDSHGHIDGDALLVHHAQILSELVPADGYLARWGGEEFVILLCRPEGKLQVKALIDSIQKRFKEIYRGLSVSASFGVSFLKPGMTQEDLTRQADAALYEAKAAGKACCRFAE